MYSFPDFSSRLAVFLSAAAREQARDLRNSHPRSRDVRAGRSIPDLTTDISDIWLWAPAKIIFAQAETNELLLTLAFERCIRDINNRLLAPAILVKLLALAVKAWIRVAMAKVMEQVFSRRGLFPLTPISRFIDFIWLWRGVMPAVLGRRWRDPRLPRHTPAPVSQETKSRRIYATHSLY